MEITWPRASTPPPGSTVRWPVAVGWNMQVAAWYSGPPRTVTGIRILEASGSSSARCCDTALKFSVAGENEVGCVEAGPAMDATPTSEGEQLCSRPRGRECIRMARRLTKELPSRRLRWISPPSPLGCHHALCQTTFFVPSPPRLWPVHCPRSVRLEVYACPELQCRLKVYDLSMVKLVFRGLDKSAYDLRSA